MLSGILSVLQSGPLLKLWSASRLVIDESSTRALEAGSSTQITASETEKIPEVSFLFKNISVDKVPPVMVT